MHVREERTREDQEHYTHKEEAQGGKLVVDIPPNLMWAVGNNAQVLITELGIIVRQMAPLRFLKWKSISDDDKLKMWHVAKVSHLN